MVSRDVRVADGGGFRRLAFASIRRDRLAPELQLVPGRHGREVEQRAAPVGVAVAEVAGALVPRDLELADLDLVVEPRAAEDQLAQPVDERLAADERHAFPVADEVAAEPAPRR